MHINLKGAEHEGEITKIEIRAEKELLPGDLEVYLRASDWNVARTTYAPISLLLGIIVALFPLRFAFFADPFVSHTIRARRSLTAAADRNVTGIDVLSQAWQIALTAGLGLGGATDRSFARSSLPNSI